MNERDFVVLVRIAVTSFWPADLSRMSFQERLPLFFFAPDVCPLVLENLLHIFCFGFHEPSRH
jgi:hypothetical protein